MIVDNLTDFAEELTQLRSSDTWIVDVETNGLDYFGMNQICGIGIAVENAAYYFPVRHQQGTNLPPTALKELIDVMNLRKSLIGYNVKFDLHFLQQDGLDVTNIELIDVLVMVRLTEPAVVKDLDLTSTLKRSYGDEAGAYDIETKKVLRSNKWNKDFSLAPPTILGPYCIKDVEWTRTLYNDRLAKLEATNQMDIFEMEKALTKVLLNMEESGISVDTKYAEYVMGKIEQRKSEIERQIYSDVGEFNINSTAQLGEVFNNNGIFSPETTPKGKQSWGEAALIQINHPLAGLVRQYRTLEKLRSTYIEPYLEKPVMHTSFCNWGTLTGRLSSREPNLQNIPRNYFRLSNEELTEDQLRDVRSRVSALIASKGGSSQTDLSDNVIQTWGYLGDEYYDDTDPTQIAIRRLFISRPEKTLIGFDYSQMEVRVFLSYLQNEEINELLKRSDTDFHGEAAKLAFNVDEESKDFKFYRQMAKAITFGTIYGIGRNKLAVQLGTTPIEAGRYKKQYFAGLKGSKEFFDSVVSTVESRGWIRNRYGRLYRIKKELGYKGVNYLVQGTSADILSERMISVAQYLADKKSRMLLQVHDEIICEIDNSELEEVPNQIKSLLEQNSLDIPLYVDMEECSPSWATKKDFMYEPVVKESCENYIDWE